MIGSWIRAHIKPTYCPNVNGRAEKEQRGWGRSRGGSAGVGARLTVRRSPALGECPAATRDVGFLAPRYQAPGRVRPIMHTAMDGDRINHALLARLARIEGPAAQRALLEALARLDGRAQLDVLRALVKRRSEDAFGRLAKMVPTLDRLTQEALIGDPALIEPIARQGMKDVDPAVRLTLMGHLARASHPCCTYIVSGGLADPVRTVRERSAEALLETIQRHRDDVKAVDGYLCQAVESAIRSYPSHQCGQAIRAAVLLGARCSEDTFVRMNEPVARMTGPLSELLRDVEPAQAADFIFLCFRHKNLASVARSYVAAADWPTLAALARREHWLSLRSIASSFEEVRHLQAVANEPAGLTELPAADQPATLRMLMASGMASKLKHALLSTALAGEEPAALAALPYVVGGAHSTTDLVLMALHCRHASVQQPASSRVIAGGADPRFTQYLLGKLPILREPTRSVMGEFLAANGFDSYWRCFRRLDGRRQEAAGQALLKLDGRVVDLLAGKLLGRDVTGQLQAVQMVRQVGLASRFGKQLARLARAGDRMVRSAAVASLGDVTGFDARSTLARCLDDPDPRVQANAVEALASQGSDSSAALDKVDSDNNRVRGNAVKWLLETNHEQGPMALAAMLTDSRVPHRISALWVVKTLRHVGAGTILARLAAADPDVKVRARASTILRSLRSGVAEGASA